MPRLDSYNRGAFLTCRSTRAFSPGSVSSRLADARPRRPRRARCAPPFAVEKYIHSGSDGRGGPRRRTAAAGNVAGARGGLPVERSSRGRRVGAGSAVRRQAASTQSGFGIVIATLAWVLADNRGVQCRKRRPDHALPYDQPGSARSLLSAGAWQSQHEAVSRGYLICLAPRARGSFEIVAALFTKLRDRPRLRQDGHAERSVSCVSLANYFYTLRSDSLRGPGFGRQDETGTRRAGTER